MLESLSISHFRGIKRLDISKFGRVNIFVGRNGAGKTTVLEAITIAGSPTQINRLIALGEWRDLNPKAGMTGDIIRSLFFNLSTDKEPIISFGINGRSHSVTYSIPTDNRRAPSITVDVSPEGEPLPEADEITALHGEYVDSERRQYALQLSVTPHGGSATFPPNVSHLGSFHIQGRRANSAPDTARVLTRLLEQKREHEFLDLLRLINPDVRGVSVGTRGVPLVLLDVGLSRLVPINIMGDGFCRLALMITGILNGKSRLLCIDEIDSGLHPSVMQEFWSWVVTLMAKTDIQLFCTTHNEDMIRNTIEPFKQSSDDLCLYRLARSVDGIVTPHSFDYELLLDAENAGADVR